MPFYMPTVNFNLLPEKHRKVMQDLVEKTRLVVMPRWYRNVYVKLTHHFLLKLLYRDSRWTVPLHYTWYMPHLAEDPGKDALNLAEVAAEEIYHSNCFGSPQPVYQGDKQYLVTREDGTTYIMKVA